MPFRLVEAKYQEQIRSLHSDMDQERETLIQQANRHRVKLEQEIETCREEEAKLREKLVFSQKVRNSTEK